MPYVARSEKRQSMECHVCAQERARRCCIISQQKQVDAYRHGIFTQAPFVHPFRSPTNQAQRLRAMEFARERESRLVWVVAYDKLVSTDKVTASAQSRAAMENWLLYDDRRTAGIPGLLPLVLDLPVRFNCEPEKGDRLKGVFTNARGWLRGWSLTPAEEARLDADDNAEVALRDRPRYLYIEMCTPHPDLELIAGKRIYTLRAHWRSWYKDGDARQVEVSRCGFPIVPDFGGTAHSYCGSSLEACIGDLLDWWVKPTRDAAVRGYIIKSRVRKAENLLMAKPYSPALFRQGPPSGPAYLLEVLKGTMTRQQAVKAWHQETADLEEKKQKQQESEAQEKWPRTMQLPCRECKKELPLKSYTTATKYDEMWSSCLSKGADLACLCCRQVLGHRCFGDQLLLCEVCLSIKRAADFANDMCQSWRERDLSREIICKRCTGEEAKQGRRAVDKTVRYPCSGEQCSSDEGQRTWPQNHFLPEDLTHAQWTGVNAECAGCQVRRTASAGDIFACTGCKERKHILNFSNIFCRQFLQGERREHTARCQECQYPKCQMCDTRPEEPVNFAALERDGSWYCRFHRYPPCCVCRTTPRDTSACHSKMKFKSWTCVDCWKKPAEERNAARAQNDPTGSIPAEHKRCEECKQIVPLTGFAPSKNQNEKRRCRTCEFPFCAGPCKEPSQKPVAVSEKEAVKPGESQGTWYCQKKKCQMAKKITCCICGGEKPTSEFKKSSTGHIRVHCCNSCQHPSCACCRQKHPVAERGIKVTSPYRIGTAWYCQKSKCQKALQEKRKEAGAWKT